MNLDVLTLINLAETDSFDIAIKDKKYIHLSTIAVYEGNSYTELPENISTNASLLNAIKSGNTKETAVEILKAFYCKFGLEHDEAIIIAYAVNKKIIPKC